MSNDKFNTPLDHKLFPDTEVIDVLEAVLTPEELKGFYKGSALVHRLCAGDTAPAGKSIDTANWYQDQLCINAVSEDTPIEDMTDPRNWQAGDWVERTTAWIGWTRGNLYRIGADGLIADDQGERCGVLADSWRFHARPDADGWIKWEGGECPVKQGTKVDLRHKDGEEFFDVKVGKATALYWSADMGIGTIIAYRPHLAQNRGNG